MPLERGLHVLVKFSHYQLPFIIRRGGYEFLKSTFGAPGNSPANFALVEGKGDIPNSKIALIFTKRNRTGKIFSTIANRKSL